MRSFPRAFRATALILAYIPARITAFSKSASILVDAASSCPSPPSGLMMSSHATNEAGARVLRVLALHGSGEREEDFPKRLGSIAASLEEVHGVKLDITTVQAPFENGSGYSWWTMPPGVRSFTATEYEGFDTSATKVLEAWDTQPPFDLVLGHSQGAILIASLIALGKVPYHPTQGYVLNGVAFPNPFEKEVASLATDKETPRVLFIIGVDDNVTPNETGEHVRDSFAKAGMNVSTVKHAGGHGPPENNDDAMSSIVAWISEG